MILQVLDLLDVAVFAAIIWGLHLPVFTVKE